MDISFKIRQLLKSNDVSQKQLAEKIGFSIPAFNNALKRNDFKTSTLLKIADTLDVEVSYFFETDTSESFPNKSEVDCKELKKLIKLTSDATTHIVYKYFKKDGLDEWTWYNFFLLIDELRNDGLIEVPDSAIRYTIFMRIVKSSMFISLHGDVTRYVLYDEIVRNIIAKHMNDKKTVSLEEDLFDRENMCFNESQIDSSYKKNYIRYRKSFEKYTENRVKFLIKNNTIYSNLDKSGWLKGIDNVDIMLYPYISNFS